MINFSIQDNSFPLAEKYLISYLKSFYPDFDIELKEFVYGYRNKFEVNKLLEFQVSSYILSINPDFVAFSAFIWNISLIKNVAKIVKLQNPLIDILVGGVEINIDSVVDEFDYCFLSEGEVAFKQWIDFKLGLISISDVCNLIYRENGVLKKNKVKLIENLDDLTFPYCHVDNTDYVALRVETSRGCPFNCQYCYYANYKKVRYFSLGYIVKNFDFLFRNYNFKFLTIIDANFNLDVNRMESVLDIIERLVLKYNKSDITLSFELKPELIDEKVKSILKKYSFKISCELGLQSTDVDVLKKSMRPFNLEKVKKGLSLLNESGVKYKIDLMSGLPLDNFYKLLSSIRFLLRYAKYQNKVPVHPFMLLNNTSFYNIVKSGNLNLVRLDNFNSSIVIKTDTQNVLDLFRTKLFVEQLNLELKYFSR